MKTCSACRESLPESAFHRQQRYCKPCANAYRRAQPSEAAVKRRSRERHATWRVNNRERANANQRAWRERNPEKSAEQSRRKRLLRYGLTVTEYDTLLLGQDGACAVCRSVENVKGRMLAVDHCHKTGRVRGLLCDLCNRALGSLRDDPVIAERAAAYLRGA